MGAAFEWVGKIVEWLGAFIPRWVILDTTEGAIKYVRGSRIVVCGPGIHWFWPVTTRWSEYPTARQTDRLETQTMETSDGKTFIVAGTITWSVEAIEKLVPTTFSPTTTVVELAASAVHDVCGDFTWEQLQAGSRKGRTLKTALRLEAQSQLTDYGVRVIKVQVTSMARCRVYKVSQSTASEET